ncbi:MAG: transporter substrate-binding domain-containing protein, partial [Clostridia bacterium]|nr:transporter substrate-binding domain-containing protein [Clostridia bacterium]
DYAPMNFTKDGVFQGFDTELALMTFNALGYDVKFTLIDWSNKYNELESNAIDCVWNGFTMNSSDEIDGVETERADIVDFTKPYMNNAQCIIRKTTTAEVTSLEQLAGKSVSYESGSAGASYITGVKEGEEGTEDDINIQLIPMGSQMDAVREVNMGTAEYAVVDLNLAKSIAGRDNYADITIDEGETVGEENSLKLPQEFYAVAFKKGSTLDEKVNIMFNAFAQTGQLKALAEKYGVGDVVIETGYLD